MTPRTKPKNTETIIDNCVSRIKQHWKKMTEIPQKYDFSSGAFKIS